MRTGRAFTLVELLVVVAIIAALLGILIPGLKRARDAARLSVCGGNLRQLAQATYTYAADFNDRVPAGPAGPSPFGRDWTQVNGAAIWFGMPLNTFMAHGLMFEDHLGGRHQVYYCPGDETTTPNVQSANIGTDTNGLSSYAYRHLSQTSDDRISDLGRNGLGFDARALYMDAESYGPTPDQYHSAHNGEQVNIAYRDGHVQRVTNAEQALAVTSDSFGSMAAVFARGDQVFVNADFAETGDPRHAPALP